MSELSEILRKEYKKKEKKKPIDFSMLMEMVEHLYDAIEPEVIEEEEARRFSVDIDLPKLIPTESWGDPGSQSRQEVERIFASVTSSPLSSFPSFYILFSISQTVQTFIYLIIFRQRSLT